MKKFSIDSRSVAGPAFAQGATSARTMTGGTSCNIGPGCLPTKCSSS
jgi:hypothetical protein